MAFVPPFCPNAKCARHAQPVPRFCCRRGYHLVAGRDDPIRRFRCNSCRRSCSRQTFPPGLPRPAARPQRPGAWTLELTPDDGRRFGGAFEVAAMTPSRTPFEIAVAPVR